MPGGALWTMDIKSPASVEITSTFSIIPSQAANYKATWQTTRSRNIYLFTAHNEAFSVRKLTGLSSPTRTFKSAIF